MNNPAQAPFKPQDVLVFAFAIDAEVPPTIVIVPLVEIVCIVPVELTEIDESLPSTVGPCKAIEPCCAPEPAVMFWEPPAQSPDFSADVDAPMRMAFKPAPVRLIVCVALADGQLDSMLAWLAAAITSRRFEFVSEIFCVVPAL